MWFTMRKVGLDFLEEAARVHVVACDVGVARHDVWRALVDPASWRHWFPGVKAASYGGSTPPYGVGTFREATVGRQRYQEYVVAWEEFRRFAYYIDRATVPIATAQLECTDLEDSAIGTRVRWTIAHDPRLLLRLVGPFFPLIMRTMLGRAMANLEAHLSTPQRPDASR